MNGYGNGGFLVPEAIHAELLSSVLTVPNELLADMPKFDLRPLTAEERAEREARRAHAVAAVTQAYETLRAAVANDPLALAVVEHHGPRESRDCHGCDLAGYDAEAPEWPCSTTRLVAERAGVEVPSDPYWTAYHRAGDA